MIYSLSYKIAQVLIIVFPNRQNINLMQRTRDGWLGKREKEERDEDMRLVG